jgi:putative hydrolase of the HAD superfamily
MDAVEYIRECMRPLSPIPAGVEAKQKTLEGIEAVVFDIYGTLIISSAGEIGTDPAHTPLDAAARVDEEKSRALSEAIVRHQERLRAEGIEYPEVEIREVWRDVTGEENRDEIEAIVIRHECSSNPVWPMPGAGEVIERLRVSGLPLGIISNAQFYTLPVMEALFGASLAGLGFHPDLQVFSFQEREGKPSLRLYERLAARAGSLGIEPERILYLGNDMVKDVLPAREAGFKTALFGGDARSLRLGGLTFEEVQDIADVVITDLRQLLPILHIAS